MGQAGDQNADRDIFNVKGDVNVHNNGPLTAIDVTLDESPPPYPNWQTRWEEAQILADLETQVQLIQVLGVGGYGKSALAARVFDQATGFQKKFWVSFRPIFAEQEFPPFAVFGRWFGRKFGYQPNPEWTDAELATEVLNRLAQQRCLLVLDNLETLLEPTGQWRDLGYCNFFRRWFETGGRGVLLITSRERPDLPANHLSRTRSYPIGGLPIEAGVALLTDQRVQGSEAELREFVVAADGHPLLLNLTVGFLKEAAGDCPPIAVLKRQEFNLLEIVGQHRGDPEASVRRVLDESLRRLDEELRAVLFEVWAFPMPFTPTLLESARNSTATEAQLRQLAKRSLLQKTYRDPEGWTFQFQPLIRTYLQQQLLDFYRATDDRLGEANTLKAIGDVLQFLDRHNEALENYQQAMGIYRQVGESPSEAPRARLGEANTLHAIGDVLQLLKRSNEALENYQQAMGIYRQVNDRLGEANTLHAIGDVLQFLDCRDEALENYQQAMEIYRQINVHLGEANTLHAIGNVLQFLDRRNEALENYQQAMEIYRQINDRLGQANILKAIGNVLQFLDRRTEALSHYQQAMDLYREVGDRLGKANTLRAIGNVLQLLNRRDEALENYQQAIEIYCQVNDRLGEANTLHAIGDELQFLDRRDEALENYQQAMEIYRQINVHLGEANVLQDLGRLQEDLQRGLDYLQQAQAIYQQIDDKYSQGRNLLFIADCQRQLQNKNAAIEALKQSAALASEINYELGQQYALNQIAALQQPDPPARSQFLLVFSKLKGWRYVLLGLLALVLVLLIRWMSHR